MSKRIFLILALLIFGSMGLYADNFVHPVDNNGVIARDMAFVGVDTYVISLSSVPVIVTSPSVIAHSGAAVILSTPTKHPCLFYGVIFSSNPINAAASQFVVVRDSVAPSRDSTHRIASNMYADRGIGGDLVQLPKYPIRIENGLSVALGTAGTTPTGEVTVFYRMLKPKKGRFGRVER